MVQRTTPNGELTSGGPAGSGGVGVDDLRATVEELERSVATLSGTLPARSPERPRQTGSGSGSVPDSGSMSEPVAGVIALAERTAASTVAAAHQESAEVRAAAAAESEALLAEARAEAGRILQAARTEGGRIVADAKASAFRDLAAEREQVRETSKQWARERDEVVVTLQTLVDALDRSGHTLSELRGAASSALTNLG